MLRWIAITMLAVVAGASSIELHDGHVVDFRLLITSLISGCCLPQRQESGDR